ncbi:hypothetical protein D5086_018014 [Populus alba]|uniref:Uncharacterized protein n=1 Tax=Populus alba TaxID=43335 RepID=A0ACC4BQ06_POPAL
MIPMEKEEQVNTKVAVGPSSLTLQSPQLHHSDENHKERRKTGFLRTIQSKAKGWPDLTLALPWSLNSQQRSSYLERASMAGKEVNVELETVTNDQ